MSRDVGSESKVPSSSQNLEHCIADIRLWMTQNLLKLYDGKTYIIYISSSCNAKSLKTAGLQIGESCMIPSGSVRDLGVMNDQVTSVCLAAYYHLKNIHSVKQFLSPEVLGPRLCYITHRLLSLFLIRNI